MKINVQDIKRLRLTTGASISDCRQALEQTNGNFEEALKWINVRGLEKAEKKAERETSQGLIEAYVHQNGRVGSMVELLCETDFVARTTEFRHLAHELAMQVAAMNPKDVDALYKQEYIRDVGITVNDLVKSVIGKLGENIVVRRFQRLVIGER